MIGKTTAVIVLLAALALGTASATSLGTFDDVSFAASDVGLLDCELDTGLDLLQLLPDIPAVGDTLTYDGTFQLTALDLSVLTDELDGLDVACITDTVLQLVLLDGDGLVLDLIEVDPDVDDLTAVSLSPGVLIDVAQIAELRAVLRDA